MQQVNNNWEIGNMNKFFLALIILTTLTACGQSTLPAPASTLVPTSIPLTPADNTITPPTAMQPTPAIPENVYNTNCIELDNESRQFEDVSGSVIVIDESDEFVNVIYNWDVTTGITPFIHLDPLSDDRIGKVAISPDHTKLAYSRWGVDSNRLIQKELVIVDFDGNEEKVIPWDDYNAIQFQWLDNQNVVTYYEMPRALPDILVVINVFTLEKFELLNKATDVNYVDSINWGMFSGSRSVYDPSLERMIYIGGNGYDLVLVNVQSGNELATVEGGFEPKWALTGKNAITVSNFGTDKQDFALISRDGNVAKISRLGDYFESVVIRSYIWAPNERYVAFWLNTNPEPEKWMLVNAGNEPVPFYHLAVLDISSKVIFDYCIPTAPNYWLYDPIWSPASDQIIITVKDSRKPPLQGNVYLIDIAHNAAKTIGENMVAQGWLIEK